MANTEDESVEARLERLRELRDRGPAAGAVGPVDPAEMKTKRERLRKLREGGAMAGDAETGAAAATPRPAAVVPGAAGRSGAADAIRQRVAGFLSALRTGSTTIPGTAYTEEGVGRLLEMLGAESERPFFERLYKFCKKPAQDGETMFNDVNLASLDRVVELLELIRTEGMESVREQLRSRGLSGTGGDGPPRARPAGAGGFGGGGAGGFAGGGAGGLGGMRRPGGGGGAGLLNRLDRRAEMEGARDPSRSAGPASGAAEADHVRELNERIARLEQTILELKAQLDKKT